MKTKISDTEIKTNFLFLAAIAIFVTLLFRNSGLFPSVADENVYSKFSRLQPLADLGIPSYIYLAIYRLTSICGDGFLGCARILNAIFFVAATPFIYLTARQVCTQSMASIVALLALLGPINSYTAYFMPEAPYFFSFWLVTWFILRLDNASNLRSWCFAGILLGFSALIKPHALLIMPGLVAYILFVSRKKRRRMGIASIMQRRSFYRLHICFQISNFLFVCGESGPNNFWPNVHSIATRSDLSNFQRYIELFMLSIENVKGHILAVCLMFGLPIALGIYASVNTVASKSEIKTDQKISVFALVVLTNLILVTGVFTATVENLGETGEILRLHLRYYDFIFPYCL